MKRKQLISIIIFIIGLITLAVGVVFLVVRLNGKPAIEDGEHLVSVGEWIMEDEDGVIWTFTEIGKGKLTTNSHLDDYDFIWALEDGKIKIETDWLYALNDEYHYRIENENLVLIRDDSSEVKFRPGGSVNSEVTEDN
ncbi:hypothetical protein IKZ77_01750 [Candidatus Saccharibacteria bacterium]|nr:hypothetical protein [Candidatus Saccharibacteria bacterium]